MFFFQNHFFLKISSGIPSVCQIVWIQIRPDFMSGPDLGPNCLQKLSAAGLKISEKGHFSWITKIIDIYGKIKIFTCLAV